VDRTRETHQATPKKIEKPPGQAEAEHGKNGAAHISKTGASARLHADSGGKAARAENAILVF
jgi:hypothetical protein